MARTPRLWDTAVAISFPGRRLLNDYQNSTVVFSAVRDKCEKANSFLTMEKYFNRLYY